TDILLLDFFNTLGMPTSTTVSIVFELLGAAVAVALIKIAGNESESISDLSKYINSENAIQIIVGILLSVVIAFTVGALVQFISRLDRKSTRLNSSHVKSSYAVFCLK